MNHIITDPSKLINLENVFRASIPDAEECKDDGDVLLQGGSTEVVVHEVGTVEEFFKVVKAQVKGDGQSDGRPQGVPQILYSNCKY